MAIIVLNILVSLIILMDSFTIALLIRDRILKKREAKTAQSSESKDNKIYIGKHYIDITLKGHEESEFEEGISKIVECMRSICECMFEIRTFALSNTIRICLYTSVAQMETIQYRLPTMCGEYINDISLIHSKLE